MNTNTDTIQEILENQKRMERILLTLVPYRRLPLDLQKRAAELQGDAQSADLNAREKVVMAEFEKMCALNRSKRRDLKWPASLLQDLHDLLENGENNLPVVPLSGLVNRCAARSAFKPVPGEISPQDNVRAVMRDLGLVVRTLNDCGLERKSKTQVVHRAGWKHKAPEVKAPVPGDDDDEDEEHAPETSPFDKMAAINMARDKANGYVEEELGEEEEEEEDEEPPAPVKKAAPVDEVTCDWSGLSATADDVEEEDVDIEEEESFEESDCAQGVATIPGRDEEEEVDIEDEWGPDELLDPEDNPVRAEFENRGEEAYRREQEKLASGDYYLLNGIVTKKRKGQ